MSLPEELAERLLVDVIEGRFPPGCSLPPEGALSEGYGVSRLTLREAVRMLRSQNVLEVRRGRGTFVNPPASWTSVPAVARAYAHGDREGAVATALLEARRMIEVGAARLAAGRRTDDDLAGLAACLDEMRRADAAGDVDLFVEADIAFHDVVLRASGNVFVPLMFEPLGAVLVGARRQTSALPAIRTHAIAEHGRLMAALASGDAAASEAAMVSHMDQTAGDLRGEVLRGG